MAEKRKPSRGLGRGLGSLIPDASAPESVSNSKLVSRSDESNNGSYRTGRQGIDTFFPQGDDSSRRKGSDLAAALAGDMRASRNTKSTSRAVAAKVITSKESTPQSTASTTVRKSTTSSSSAKTTSTKKRRDSQTAEDLVIPADEVASGISAVDSISNLPGSVVGDTTVELASPEGAALSTDGENSAINPDVVEVEASPVEVSRETSEDQTPLSENSELDLEVPDVINDDHDVLELVPVPGASFAELSVLAIRPNPRQPREVFDEEALEELIFSIREIGVLQPIVVRPIPLELQSVVPDGIQYEIIMGERRWRASKGAGKDFVPAIIRTTSDDDLLRDALLENLHRSQLNPLEEAAAYSQLLDDFGCTQEELASRIGRSRPQISNMMRLMKLPPLVQRRVAAGVLTMGHARALLGLKDNVEIERVAQKVVAEGLSVRTTEEIVALGGLEDKAPIERRIGRTINPVMDDIAGRLSDRFDTRVKIALGTRKGKLTVEFSGVDDLHRILSVIAPGENVVD